MDIRSKLVLCDHFWFTLYLKWVSQRLLDLLFIPEIGLEMLKVGKELCKHVEVKLVRDWSGEQLIELNIIEKWEKKTKKTEDLCSRDSSFQNDVCMSVFLMHIFRGIRGDDEGWKWSYQRWKMFHCFGQNRALDAVSSGVDADSSWLCSHPVWSVLEFILKSIIMHLIRLTSCFFKIKILINTFKAQILHLWGKAITFVISFCK